MKRSSFLCLAVFAAALLNPAALFAEYLYPESAAYQPLAVIEPASPDSLFQSWTGDIGSAGRTNLGAKLDFLRYEDNTDDWDIIMSATASFRRSENLLFGITIPSIIRDPEFHESDLLDIHAFARKRLTGSGQGFGISGELSAILPTAREDMPYPFTLGSTVLGARLALYTGTADGTRMGLNIGYQNYLQTETGDDSDLIYSTWLEKKLNGPWNLVAELHGSQHSHSGVPGDDKVSDNYVLVGARRIHSDRTSFGISAGSGLGGDSIADLRVTALAMIKFGAVKETVGVKKAEKKKKAKPEKKAVPEKPVEEKPKEITPEKVTPAPAPSAIVVVMIAEGVTGPDTVKRITKALQGKGFATGTDPNPGIRNTGRNILYYMPGMKDRAQKVADALVSSGSVKGLRIEESKVRLPGGWLLLMPGGEK